MASQAPNVPYVTDQVRQHLQEFNSDNGPFSL